MNTNKLMAEAINLGRKNLIEWQEYGDALKSQLDAANAKLSERKTVHQWLNAKGTPREENGKPLCLLRRLAIALEIHDPQPAGELADCLAVRPECRECGTLMDYGQAIPPAVVVMDHGQQTEGAWDGVAPLVAVWKCPSCGHSFSKSNAESIHQKGGKDA